ncbi:MAG: DUF642 domain-containing protein [Acidobacteriaceae bacterium]|nr:DUF642 domain-containing protein [Acidobacteriaceae bacterium]
MNKIADSKSSSVMPIVSVVFRSAVLLTVSCATASANLITDGGFEMPVVGPGGMNSGTAQFVPGQVIDGVWSVFGSTAGNVSVYPNTETGPGSVTYTVQEGTQALDLTGTLDNGASIGVQQQISTVVGTVYNLTFYLGDINNPGYPQSGAATVAVQLNGSSFQTATNDGASPLSVNFEQFTYLFTATGSSTTIGFLNESAARVGINAIDNVSVNAATTTPEPATDLVILAGLAGIFWTNRKKRNPADR